MARGLKRKPNVVCASIYIGYGLLYREFIVNLLNAVVVNSCWIFCPDFGIVYKE